MQLALRLRRLTARAAQSPRLSASPGAAANLPWPVRFLIADVFTQIEAGERAALRAARRVAKEETDPEARAFARVQESEEERHVAFFAEAIAATGIRRVPMRKLDELFELATAARGLPYLLLANHLVVETLAHELFGDLSALLASAWWPSGWRGGLGALAQGVCAVRGDETRHVAFGVLRLRALRGEMSPAARTRFERAAVEWEGRLGETLRTLPVFAPARPWFRARAEAVVQTYRQRCRSVGVSG